MLYCQEDEEIMSEFSCLGELISQICYFGTKCVEFMGCQCHVV